MVSPTCRSHVDSSVQNAIWLKLTSTTNLDRARQDVESKHCRKLCHTSNQLPAAFVYCSITGSTAFWQRYGPLHILPWPASRNTSSGVEFDPIHTRHFSAVPHPPIAINRSRREVPKNDWLELIDINHAPELCESSLRLEQWFQYSKASLLWASVALIIPTFEGLSM